MNKTRARGRIVSKRARTFIRVPRLYEDRRANEWTLTLLPVSLQSHDRFQYTRYIYNGLILHSNVRTRTERPFDRYMRFPSRFLEIAAFPAEKIQRKHAKPLEKFVDSNYDHQISRQLERRSMAATYT